MFVSSPMLYLDKYSIWSFINPSNLCNIIQYHVSKYQYQLISKLHFNFLNAFACCGYNYYHYYYYFYRLLAMMRRPLPDKRNEYQQLSSYDLFKAR